MANKISDKTIWITGATAGLGEALAETLAQQGASLILSGRRADALQELEDRLPKGNNQQHCNIAFDLALEQDYSSLTQVALDKMGQIDILIHNAGLSQKGFFADTKPEVEETLWRVNYLSTVALTRAVLPQMIQQGGGQLVVVGSIAGRYGAPFLSTYSATKHALYGFYESLRYEVEQHGISILMVTPGFIKNRYCPKGTQ